MENQIKKTSSMVNIAGYTNKLVKLSKLMMETKSDYLVDKMGYLDENSDPYDIALEFNKDLGSTANMVRDMAIVVASIDANHQAKELDCEVTDFRELFPDNYCPENQKLDVFGIALRPDGGRFGRLTNREIKKHVYETIFEGDSEHDFESFMKHISNLKKLSGLDRPTRESSFDEVLGFAALESEVPKWQSFYKKALESADRFHDYRDNLNDRDRKVLDTRVLSGRATIYGVVKTSTEIKSGKGVIGKVSKNHNVKAPDGDLVVNKVASLVTEIPFLTGAEIDKMADIVKFHDMLVDMKYMGLDVAVGFEIKARHLGNYKASGLAAVKTEGGFMVSEESGFANAKRRVVAFDFESGTGSVAHELAHIRDINYDENRARMVSHFTDKIDTDLISKYTTPKQQDYFTNDREIIARIGEIGFLLQMHEYKHGETISEFTKRVQEQGQPDAKYASEKIGYDVSLVKSLDHYLGEGNDIHREIYFNFSEWSPEESQIVMDYTRDFYFKHDPIVSLRLKDMMQNGQLNVISEACKYRFCEQVGRTRALTEDDKIGSVFGRISTENLPLIYSSGVEKGYFEDGEFPFHLSKHATRPGKGGAISKAHSSIKFIDLENQLSMLTEFANSINVDARPVDAIMTRAFLVKYLEKSKLNSENQIPLQVKVEVDFLEKMMSKLNFVSVYDWEDEVDVYSKNNIRFSPSYYNVNNSLIKPHFEGVTNQVAILKEAIVALSDLIENRGVVVEGCPVASVVKELPLIHAFNKSISELEPVEEGTSDFVLKSTPAELLSKMKGIDAKNAPKKLIKMLSRSPLIDDIAPIRQVMYEVLKHESSIIKGMFVNSQEAELKIMTDKLSGGETFDSFDEWIADDSQYLAVEKKGSSTGSVFKLTAITKYLIDSGISKSDISDLINDSMGLVVEIPELITENLKRIGAQYSKTIGNRGVNGVSYDRKTGENHPIFMAIESVFISKKGDPKTDSVYEMSTSLGSFIRGCVADDFVKLASHSRIQKKSLHGKSKIISSGDELRYIGNAYVGKMIDFISEHAKNIISENYTPTQNTFYKNNLSEITKFSEKVKSIMSSIANENPELARKLIQACQLNRMGGVGYAENEKSKNMAENLIQQLGEKIAVAYIPTGKFFGDAREISFLKPSINVQHSPDNALNYLVIPYAIKPEKKGNGILLTKDENLANQIKLKEVAPEIAKVQKAFRF